MKYIGGKYRIRDEIAATLSEYLTKSNTFIDLFCGSCNISIAMLKQNPNIQVYANDLSTPLITMFNSLKGGWLPPDDLSAAEWKALKINQDVDNPLTAFAGFGCSFSGKYFTSYAVDKLTNRNYCKEAKSNILKDLVSIKKIQYSNLDYKDFPLPNEPSLIYCDIPYYNSNKDNQYKSWGIAEPFNHTEFYTWAETTAAKGHTVIVSEYYESIRATKYFYNIIWSKCSKASVCNISGSSNKVIEVLIKI